MIYTNSNKDGNKIKSAALTVARMFNNFSRGISLFLILLKVRSIRHYLKEFVRKTDLYLHYSNYILFEKSGFLPALKFILLKIRSAGGRIFDSLAEVPEGPEARFAAIQNYSENINSFDGVIERYCGVPP